MSVRKRSWTSGGTQKSAWVVDYTDSAGRRHLETFATKREADAAQARIKVAVAGGTHTASSESATVDKACVLFLEGCAARGLERTSVEAYRQHLELHVRPYLGRKKLTSLTPAVIRTFEEDLRLGKPASSGSEQKPRSPDMVRRVVRTLGTMLGDAQERGLVGRNIVAERSKRRGSERRLERRHRGRLVVGRDIPSPDEIKAILATAEGRWRPFLLTAIFAGLRASELRGLRWTDVDFDRREIHVRQRADNRGSMGSPKSETSQRTIPLPPTALNALREWRLACPKGAANLVFPTGTGRAEGHANIVQRGWQPTQVRAGIVMTKKDKDGKIEKDASGQPIMIAKYPGLHALRHFFASWCINRPADGGLGLPLKVVQERLGHSTITLTADRYGHLFPRGDDADELAAAEQALIA